MGPGAFVTEIILFFSLFFFFLILRTTAGLIALFHFVWKTQVWNLLKHQASLHSVLRTICPCFDLDYTVKDSINIDTVKYYNIQNRGGKKGGRSCLTKIWDNSGDDCSQLLLYFFLFQLCKNMNLVLHFHLFKMFILSINYCTFKINY